MTRVCTRIRRQVSYNLSLFHSRGPSTEKARLPNFRFVRRMVKSPRVFDRSSLELAAAQDVTMVDIYEGAVPDRIWYIRRETLKAIRARTGSQCRSFRDGVI